MSDLEKARTALTTWENRFGTEEGIQYLAKGLDLLDEIAESDTEDSKVARNIGNTYFEKLIEGTKARLETGTETEPDLEILYRTILEFEVYSFGKKDELSRVKINTFNQLFNRYYQGYTQEEKRKAIRELLGEEST